jgi:hypothetical protein
VMTRVSLLVISVVATISPMRQFFLLAPLLLLIGCSKDTEGLINEAFAWFVILGLITGIYMSSKKPKPEKWEWIGFPLWILLIGFVFYGIFSLMSN